MKAQGKSLQLLTRGKHKYISSKSNHINKCKSFLLFYSKNIFFLFYTLIFTKQRHQSIYSIHLFNKIFIHLQFFIISSLTTPLSHIPNTTKKNTKILYAQATISVYICTITVELVHLCTIFNLLMWCFLGQNVHISTLFLFCTILHVSALTLCKGSLVNNVCTQSLIVNLLIHIYCQVKCTWQILRLIIHIFKSKAFCNSCMKFKFYTHFY